MLDAIRQQIIDLNYQVVQLYSEGRFRESIPLAQQASDMARQHLGEHDPEYAASLNNLAALYESSGEYVKAEQCYKQTQAIYRLAPQEHALQLAGNLNDLGFLYTSLGNYAAAESLYREALATWPADVEGVQLAVAQTLNNLGLLYQAMGDYRTAEPLLQRALRIRQDETGANQPIVARSLNNLAELYRARGLYNQAEPLYQEALHILQNTFGDKDLDVANILNNMAALSRGRRDYAGALSLYQQALRIWQAALGKSHPFVASCLHNLAVTHQTLGKFVEAEPLYRASLALRRQALGPNHPDVASSLFNLAGLLAATGQGEQALSLLEEATSIYDRMIGQVFSIGSEYQRLAYLAIVQNTLDAFLSFVLDRYAHDTVLIGTAFDLVLRRKALTAESLMTQRDAVHGGRYPALAPLLRNLMILRRQLAHKTLAGPGAEGTAAYRQLLDKWETQCASFEAEIAQQIPEMNLTQRLRDANREAIAAALPENTLLVEFIRFDAIDFAAVPAQGYSYWKSSRYLAFVLFAGAPDQSRMIDLGGAERIDAFIGAFRASITREEEVRGLAEASAETSSSTAGDRQVSDDRRTAILAATRDLLPEPLSLEALADDVIGTQLREALLDPLLPVIGTYTRLFLAPDSDLCRLPFEVLPLADGRRVIEAYHVSYVSVGRDILRFGTESGLAAGKPLIAADPDFNLATTSASAIPSAPFRRLVGTRDEGLKIAAQLGVEPWLEGSVLEASIKACRSPRILHLATHGFFLPDQPQQRIDELPEIAPLAGTGLERLTRQRLENPLLRSGLALAGANTWLGAGDLPDAAEDGLLTAADVVGLDLSNTDLVVLSACQTGLGEIKTGEGVFGLRRAFMLAGAKTLVISLWKVPDDATQTLMVDFYRRLLQGQPRATALRAAQRALQSNKQFADPFFWGAFVCQGEPGPLPRDGLGTLL